MSVTEAEFRKIKRLAGRAGSLLADDDFREMLADLKNIAIRDWANGDTKEKREEAWHALQAVAGLENLMKCYGQTLRTEEAKHARD